MLLSYFSDTNIYFMVLINYICDFPGARVSLVGWSTIATSRKVAGSIPDEFIEYFNWSNPSSRTMALVSTQPLAEVSNRNLSGVKGRPVRKTDNLTAICEPII
jgi:hypothetical protein